MTKETGGSAFPSDVLPSSGMTLRQYAAIKLKVPDSGTDWLDVMIAKSLRDNFAANALERLTAGDVEMPFVRDFVISDRTHIEIIAAMQDYGDRRAAAAVLAEREQLVDLLETENSRKVLYTPDCIESVGSGEPGRHQTTIPASIAAHASAVRLSICSMCLPVALRTPSAKSL